MEGIKEKIKNFKERRDAVTIVIGRNKFEQYLEYCKIPVPDCRGLLSIANDNIVKFDYNVHPIYGDEIAKAYNQLMRYELGE